MNGGSDALQARSSVNGFVNRALRSLLTHPLTIRLKRRLRDLSWDLNSPQIGNPPFPPIIRSMLFICLGNICRSPFAAQLAARKLSAAGFSDVVCQSAGIRPSQAGRSPEEACAAAAQYGLDLSQHVPQCLTRQLLADHDVVFVMETAQMVVLASQHAEYSNRLFLLPLFDLAVRGGYARYNIADPFGNSLSAYLDCYERLERAVTAVVSALAANRHPSC